MVHRASTAYRALAAMLGAPAIAWLVVVAVAGDHPAGWIAIVFVVLAGAVVPVIGPSVDDTPPAPAPGTRLASRPETVRAAAAVCGVVLLIAAAAAVVSELSGDRSAWIPALLLGLGSGHAVLAARVARHERRHPEIVRALRLVNRHGPVDWRRAWCDVAP
jgi:hypothetical protein